MYKRRCRKKKLDDRQVNATLARLGIIDVPEDFDPVKGITGGERLGFLSAS